MHVDATAPEADLGICISKQTSPYLEKTQCTNSGLMDLKDTLRCGPLDVLGARLRYHLPWKRGGCGKLSALGRVLIPWNRQKIAVNHNIIVFEGATLEEARKKLFSDSPRGLFLQSETAIPPPGLNEQRLWETRLNRPSLQLSHSNLRG